MGKRFEQPLGQQCTPPMFTRPSSTLGARWRSAQSPTVVDVIICFYSGHLAEETKTTTIVNASHPGACSVTVEVFSPDSSMVEIKKGSKTVPRI